MALKIMDSNRRWHYIFFGIVVMLLLGTVYAYSVFRVALEKDLQIGSVESGMPYMVSLACYALFMFLTGRVIERYPPRTVLMIGGVLIAIGWILSSFSTNIYWLTITYGCISGAGVGIAYGVPMSVVAKWFPDQKGLAVGLVLIGFGLSPLITAPLARQLVAQYGVMSTFLLMGIGFGILIPLIALTFKNPSSEAVATYRKHSAVGEVSSNLPLKAMMRTRSFKGIYLNFWIGTMIGLMMVGMTTQVGLEFFRLESSTVVGSMAQFAIFNGLGRPAFGWFTDRFASKTAMLLSYALIASSAMGVIVFGPHMGVYLVTFSIFWFNLGGWLAIAPTSTLKLYGSQHYSHNYGLVFTAYGIGAIAGVSTTGFLLDAHGNYQYVFYYVMALCLLGALITYIFMDDF